MSPIIQVASPTGNAVIDTANINAAIQQANEAYLAGGSIQQIEVRLSAGTYVVLGDPNNPSQGAVELKSGVALIGQGMADGASGTTIKLVDDFNARINGIVRTDLETVDNIRIAGLTIDGNRANNTNQQTGFICGIKDDGSGRVQSNITLSNVEIKNCTGYGFNPHEISYNVTIENCISRSNGLDGFVADLVIGGVYRNNLAYSNDRHGFNIQNASSNILLQDNESFDNGSTGLCIQRGNIIPTGYTFIPWVTNVDVIGGAYFGNAREGIIVKLSDNVSISGVQVYNNNFQGIRIEGATHTVVENSTVFNNSQALHNGYDEIQIRVRFDDVTNLTYQSTGTMIFNNNIYSDAQIRSRYGIYESPDVEGVNYASNNTIVGVARSPTYFSPQLITSAENQVAQTGEPFSYQVPPSSFVDGDDGTFTLSATLTSGAPLPSWLTFDPSTGQFSGTPPTSGNVGIVVLAQDAQGLVDTTNFEIIVTGSGPGVVNITGTSGNDTLVGSSGPEYIAGLGGDDILNGGGGPDRLDGGTGQDTATYVGSPAGVIVDLVTGTGSSSDADGDTLVGIEHLSGSAFADQLSGDNLPNILFGGSGDDTLLGRGGADTLDGGAGGDRLEGGDGDDLYVIDDTGDLIVEFDNGGLGGLDTVRSTISYSLPANVENLTLLGLADLDATGNGKANVLIGNDGANILDGGPGNDTMQGGLGDDIYYVNTTSDTVIELVGAGVDTVRSTVSRTLEANVENLTLLGSAAANATGNNLANILIGNDAANILTGNAGDDLLLGGGGDDTLRGGAGSDMLDGGAGADRMEGGDGSDTYVVDNLRDSVIEKSSSVTGGVDTVWSSVSWVLGKNVENLTLLGASALNGTGNALANVLLGNSATNILNGGAGDDTIRGYAGDDRLTGGTGNDELDGGVGQDVAVFSGDISTYSIITSAGSIQIRDNDTSADGNDGTDTLIGIETAEFKGGSTINLLAPIVLDLDGNGIHLIKLDQSGVALDFNGDGEQTRTGWVSAGDAFLVLDRDGNGTVSNSSELSFVDDKAGARSDLDGLSIYDSNGDGSLSSADQSFTDFMLWSDKNSNGRCDIGELMSLAEAGIASLSLTSTPTERIWAADENIVVGSGSFLRTDGSTGWLADVALRHENLSPREELAQPSLHEDVWVTLVQRASHQIDHWLT